MLNHEYGWLPVLKTPDEVAADLIALAGKDLPKALEILEEIREKEANNQL